MAMGIGQRTVRALDRRAGQMAKWSVHMVKNPKNHREDRMVVRNQDGEAVCKARLEVWKSSVALAFTADMTEDRMNRLLMRDGWDGRGAAASILACLAARAVPKEERVRQFGHDMTALYHVKLLQDRIRKDPGWDMSELPPPVHQAVMLLGMRYKSLSGQDVEERLDGLRDPLRFLISKGVPWERVREIWKEEECRIVLDS